MLTHILLYFHSVRSKAKTHFPSGLTMAMISFAKIEQSIGASFRKRLSRLCFDSLVAERSKTGANFAKFEVFCWIIAINKAAKNSTRRLSNGKFALNA